MNSKIELIYLLFWKKQKFYITGPNTTKKFPCTLPCIKLSIHINNATSHTTTEPLQFFLCILNFKFFTNYKIIFTIILAMATT